MTGKKRSKQVSNPYKEALRLADRYKRLARSYDGVNEHIAAELRMKARYLTKVSKVADPRTLSDIVRRWSKELDDLKPKATAKKLSKTMDSLASDMRKVAKRTSGSKNRKRKK